MKNRSPLEILNIVLLLGIIAFSFLIYFTIDPRVIDGILDPPYLLFLPILLPQWAILYWIYRSKGKIQWRSFQFLFVIILESIMILVYQAEVLNQEISNLFDFGLSFLGHAVIHITALVVFLLSAFSLGHIILETTKDNPWVKIAFGIIIQTTILTFFGIWLGLSMPLVLLIILLPFILAIRKWPSLLTTALLKKKQTKLLHLDTVILLPILWVSLGYSLIGMIKPMAVGHDGNSVYAYLSKQVATGYPFPTAGQAYPWSVYLSLPEVLTNIHSLSLFFTQAFGFICLSLLFSWGRSRISYRFSIWQTTLLSMSPFLLFHLIIDEKVDLGSLFFVIIALKMAVDSLSKKTELHLGKIGNVNLTCLPMIILFLVFATLIKYTAIFYILSLALALYSQRNTSLGTVGLFLAFIASTIFIIDNSGSNVNSYIGLSPLLQILTGATGLALLGMDVIKNSTFTFTRTQFKETTLTLLLCLAITIPWLLFANFSNFNNGHPIEANHNEINLLIVPDQLGSNHNLLNEYLNADFHPSPQNVQLNPYTTKQKKERGTISQNESLRYLGLERGASKWISLPFDFIFNSNTPKNTGNQWGILPFILVIVLLFIKGHRIHSGLVFFGLLLIFGYLIVGVGSNLFHLKVPGNTLALESSLSTVPWTDSVIFKSPFHTLLTFLPEGLGIILLMIACSLLLFFLTSKRVDTNYRFTSVFLFTPMFFWLFTGSGILWYVLPSLTLFYLFLFPKKYQFTRGPLNTILLVTASVQIFLFLVNISKSNYPEQDQHLLFPDLVVDYSTNIRSLGRSPAASLPKELQQTLRSINRSDGNIYMVNTPLRYFIDQKGRKIIEDDYLNEFWGYRNKLNSIDQFPDLLAANNYEYIAYDLTTQSRAGVEVESLNERCQKFLAIMTNHPRIEIEATNNIIESDRGMVITLGNGQQVTGAPGLRGKTVVLGSYVIFKVKK